MRRAALERGVYRGLLLGIVALVFLNGLAALAANPQRIVPGTDSEQYDTLARTLEANRGYSTSGPPFDPTFYREPGYPLFVAALYRPSNNSADMVAVAQVVVLALTTGLVGVVAGRVFNPAAGLAAAALFGFSPELDNYAGYLLSETLFTLPLFGALALALVAQQRRKPVDFLAAGIGLGLAAMVRTIALALAPPVALVLLLSTGGIRNRSAWLRAALVLVGAVLVIAPWLVRNGEAVGRLTLTSRDGVVVIRRTPRAAEPWSSYPTWIQVAAWRATSPISSLIVPESSFQYGPQPEDSLLWDFDVNDSVRYYNRYDPVCRAAANWDDCATTIGLNFIRHYPLQYLLQSGFEFVKLQFAPFPSPPGEYHDVQVWLGLLGMVVLAVSRRLTARHWLLVLPLATYVAVSILLDTQTRYILPLLPVYTVFGGGLIAALLRLPLRALAASAAFSAASTPRAADAGSPAAQA